MRVPSEPEWNKRYEDAGRVTFGMLLDGGLRRMTYVYDMGDDWEHSIIIEKVAAPLPDVTYPQYLGERRCPPEDCGGVPGYFEFLKNVLSKQKRLREHALTWYGGPYDPDDIDEAKIESARPAPSRSAGQCRPSRRCGLRPAASAGRHSTRESSRAKS